MTHTERVVFVSDFFKTPGARNKWMRVVDHLGIKPDRIVARRLNVTTSRVCTIRRAMGIAPVSFPKSCEHYGTVPPERPMTLM